MRSCGLGVWPEGAYQKLEPSGGSKAGDLEAEQQEQPEGTWFRLNNTSMFVSLSKSVMIKQLKSKSLKTQKKIVTFYGIKSF